MRRRAQSDDEGSGGSEDFAHTGSQALLDDGGKATGRSVGSRLVAFLIVVAGLVCVGTLAVSQGVINMHGHLTSSAAGSVLLGMVGSGPGGEVQPLRRGGAKKKKKKQVYNSVEKVDKVS